MRVAIIGSRTFNDYELLKKQILDNISLDDIEVIVSGGAKGADTLGERFADEFNIKKNIILPNWQKYGKSAGFKRNIEIINNCDIVFAFCMDNSTGTMDSVRKAEFKLIPVILWTNN